MLALIDWLADRDRRADTSIPNAKPGWALLSGDIKIASANANENPIGTVPPGESFLPGDIKYESPNGNVRIYFAIVTAIILSILFTLILRFIRTERPSSRGDPGLSGIKRTKSAVAEPYLQYSLPRARGYLLLEVKRTSARHCAMSANDSKPTSSLVTASEHDGPLAQEHPYKYRLGWRQRTSGKPRTVPRHARRSHTLAECGRCTLR